jgi:hypothetical protein
MSARRVLGSILAAAAGLALTAGSAAAGSPIGPNERFAGVVNGQTQVADVVVICPGIANTGHPRAGQPVEVVQGTGGGFTGRLANHIQAALALGAVVTTMNFTEYGAPQDIPTNILVPCSGTGQAAFTPLPTSSTAQSAFVTLRFINVGA